MVKLAKPVTIIEYYYIDVGIYQNRLENLAYQMLPGILGTTVFGRIVNRCNPRSHIACIDKLEKTDSICHEQTMLRPTISSSKNIEIVFDISNSLRCATFTFCVLRITYQPT